MKKWLSSLCVLCLLTAAFVTGCGDEKPAELTLENGVISWEAVAGVTDYMVDFGAGQDIVKSTSFSVADACELPGEYTVTVSAVNGTDTEPVGQLSFLAAPLETPGILLKQTDGKPTFTWQQDERAVAYTYDVYDGKGSRPAEATNGQFAVTVTDTDKELITVTAHGTSQDRIVYLSQTASYQYESSRLFDLTAIVRYPFVYSALGQQAETFEVTTSLSRGTYELEMDLYVMDSLGRRVAGNGSWGRRITDSRANIWFCENELEEWPGSGGTNPYPDEPVTVKLLVNVDKAGNALVPFYNFKSGEMVIFADVRYNGKSVIEDEKRTVEIDKSVRLDLSDASKFLMVFTSPGTWSEGGSRSALAIQIPTNLPDGKHTVAVSYYVCDSDGGQLTGNGMWGRRLAEYTEGDPKQYVWFTEYGIEGQVEPMDLPEPTTLVTSRFSDVEVKNGVMKLLALNFRAGEKVAVAAVKAVETPKGNGIYVATGAANGEKFTVETSHLQRGQVDLQITFQVSDISGASLSGNGTWGRRLIDESADEHWLCQNAVDGHPDSPNTLPKAGQSVTQTFKVSINKLGKFSLMAHNFKAGEMVRITSIKLNGQEILV